VKGLSEEELYGLHRKLRMLAAGVFTTLVLAATLSAGDLSGTWFGTWGTGGADRVCLALSQTDHRAEGSIAYSHDANYQSIAAQVLTTDRIVFTLKDRHRGAILFRLTAAGVGLQGEAVVGTRSEPVSLQKYAPSGTVFRYGPAIAGPVLIRKRDPEYTAEARAAHLEGAVVLMVPLQSDGSVGTDVKVLQSLGMGLDAKAIECVRRWQFSPPREDCRPANTRVQVEIEFRLL
jgi:TonB family protein